MIRVTVYYQNNLPVGFKVLGHAGSGPYGHDLVCAAVSSIITGGFNAFRDEDIVKCSLNEGEAEIEIYQNDKSVVILSTLIRQLETIAEAYPKNLKIK